ncbi:M20 family metallopeptidase [Clostridioides difficile]|nr:M20 family metallopeptidase [Clostridioides difficile]
MKKILLDTLNSNKQEYIDYLKELVSIKTEDVGHGILGGFEKEGQEYIEELANSIGFSVNRQEMNEDLIKKAKEIHKEGNLGHNYDDRYNLICKYSDNLPGKKIVFNGHVDTMPPGDTNKWRYNPYCATEDNGKLYGIGTADMKAGLMASILAVKLIKDSGLNIPGNIKVMSVVDEEGGGNGTINAVMNGIDGDYCVICEPSEKNIIIAHMGFVFFEVEVKGVSLHCGSKWEGVNAIEKSMLLLQDIKELEHNWLMKYKHTLLPPPTINLGVINGGTAGSTVPDKCVFNLCVHFLPNTMSYEQVVDDITKVIMTRADGDLWLKNNKPQINIYQSGLGFEMDKQSEFVVNTKKILEETLERKLNIKGSTAGNDARLMKNLANIPTLILGPGSIEQCHSIDEYVEIQEYLDSILMYASLILNL